MLLGQSCLFRIPVSSKGEKGLRGDSDGSFAFGLSFSGPSVTRTRGRDSLQHGTILRNVLMQKNCRGREVEELGRRLSLASKDGPKAVKEPAPPQPFQLR
jgi:transposase